MDSNEKTDEEMTWERPTAALRQARYEANRRENISIFRMLLITVAIASPISVVAIKWLRLEMPVWPVIVVPLIGALLPLVQLLLSAALERRLSRTQSPYLYRVTKDGLELPQHGAFDRPFIRWNEVKWWRVRNAKRLTGFREIAIAVHRFGFRRLWLPSSEMDAMIISSFEKYVGPPRS
ncbi:MAG TPA: hypothetical protein VLI90_02515 [Tepidisphaeraceae bacterium]|nr:hypothetical protein [Tepidisphaeraceae bacterium]